MWVSVNDRLPEFPDQEVIVTDGDGYAVGYWREDAQAWDSYNFGWLEREGAEYDESSPCRLGKVTHWMAFEPFPGAE